MEGRPPKLDGRLVLSGESNTYLLDMHSREVINLGNTRYEAVSPDGQWLAVSTTTRQKAAVFDYNGKQIKMYPEEFLSPAYWLDNQRMVFHSCISCVTQNYLDGYSMVLYDLITDERKEWFPDDTAPAVDDFNAHWAFDGGMVFNPDISYLVYPNGWELYLWDISAQKLVSKIGRFSTSSEPIWLPDGNHFLVRAVIDERGAFYLISSQGEVQRLTDVNAENNTFFVRNTGSPDGERIVFLSSKPNGLLDLQVMDLNSWSITNFCGDSRWFDEGSIFTQIIPPKPVWSPDGRYLAYTTIDDKRQYKVFLLELETARTWRIASNVSARGWMVKP
jgi:Tol biopolymer transport system component